MGAEKPRAEAREAVDVEELVLGEELAEVEEGEEVLTGGAIYLCHLVKIVDEYQKLRIIW